MDLFSQRMQNKAPLADRMRPATLDEFLGQEHIVGPGRLLRRAIEADRLTSRIFFGPPGTGKTTLAAIIAATTQSAFAKLNAVTAGVKDVRAIIEEAEERLRLYGQSTYLLLDECHRWSKAQSDSILPAMEKGIIRFIGSTTENPMVAMTPAIVSRCRLFQFRALTAGDIKTAMKRAIADPERGFGKLAVAADEEALNHIADVASGDVRSALNAIELAVLTTPAGEDGKIHVTREIAAESIQRRVLSIDESMMYDMLSAFCKSLRGSDSTAAMAWFARLISAGIDPRILARRIIAHASEDVGLANPSALTQAVAAAQALELIGMPEARLAMTQAIIFICESPKSNAVVMAIDRAMADAEKYPLDPVPVHLRDTSYAGHQRLGSGKGYRYPHEYPGHYLKQEYRPKSVEHEEYFIPEIGYERRFLELRKERKQPPFVEEGKEERDD